MGQLDLTTEQDTVLNGAVQAQRGLILAAGTGAESRLATLRGLAVRLATPERSVFVAEPQVAQDVPGISQTEVADGALYEWLGAVLGADADVIMVSAVPTAAVAALLVRAARGALVLAGVEARSSAEALLTFVNFGLPPKAAAAIVTCIICRWDLPRLCRHCRRASPATQARLERHPRLAELAQTARCVVAAGCPECSSTGHDGSVALLEVVSVGSVVGPLLADLAEHPALIRAARQTTTLALTQAALPRLVAGDICADDLMDLLDTATLPSGDPASPP